MQSCQKHYPTQRANNTILIILTNNGLTINTKAGFVYINPTTHWLLSNCSYTCNRGIGFLLEYPLFLFQQLFHLNLVLPLHLLDHSLMALLHAAEAKLTSNLTDKQGYILYRQMDTITQQKQRFCIKIRLELVNVQIFIALTLN